MYNFKEEYMLGQSETKSIQKVAEAIRLDLTLLPSPFVDSGTLKGKVRDNNGNPIPDAVVLILDESNSTLANTVTGNDGSYLFNTLKPGSGYQAYAKAPGFELSEKLSFIINPNDSIEYDFLLVPDSSQQYSVIVGVIQNNEDFPVNTASVELFRAEDSRTVPVSLTFTNEIGQFVFSNLNIGSYVVKVNANGYFSEHYPVIISSMNKIIPVNIRLREDMKASKGIIAGVITNNEEQPLADADVILYRLNEDGSQSPVDFTRSNKEGVYLFVNVPHGQYCVNSNRYITVK